jgi:hypothetical protein
MSDKKKTEKSAKPAVKAAVLAAIKKLGGSGIYAKAG